MDQIIKYPKIPPIKEFIKFGKIGFRLGSKDFANPITIKEKVITFGMMKCLRSIKKIIKKDNERIAKKKVVRVAPNLK